MSTIAATNLKNASSGTNNIVLGTDGTTTIAAPSNIIKRGTAAATTSGVSIDFTGLPSWVRRVQVVLDLVSTNGTSPVIIRLGTSAGFATTGYSSSAQNAAAGNISSTGLVLDAGVSAAGLRAGIISIINIDGNTWVSSGDLPLEAGGATAVASSGGRIALASALTQVRLTTEGGVNTFDNGTVNILYEG